MPLPRNSATVSKSVSVISRARILLCFLDDKLVNRPQIRGSSHYVLLQSNRVFVTLLLTIRNKVIVSWVLEVMKNEDLFRPPRIRIFGWYKVIFSNFFQFVSLVKFFNGQSLSSKLVAEPNVIADDIVKVHKYSR